MLFQSSWWRKNCGHKCSGLCKCLNYKTIIVQKQCYNCMKSVEQQRQEYIRQQQNESGRQQQQQQQYNDETAEAAAE